MKKLVGLLCVNLACSGFAAETYQEDSWKKDKVQIEAQILEQELALYESLKKQTYVGAEQPFDPLRVVRRRIDVVSERYDRNPQAFFYFKVDGQTYVGRKVLSDLVVQRGLPGLFCSAITEEMILGLWERDRASQDEIRISYFGLTPAEKKYLFGRVKANLATEVWYPHVQLLGVSHKEKTTPSDGWVVDEVRAFFLGMGEEEIRRYTATKMIEWYGSNRGQGLIVYDPACSTGQFLKNIKDHLPLAHTIGQELSQQMVSMAGQRVDEVHFGDSINPAVRNDSVDIVFFRFLNGEVVITESAHKLFASLLRSVKSGGRVVVLGHTPILIDGPFMESFGLSMQQAIGVSADEKSVFQYYVLRKER